MNSTVYTYSILQYRHSQITGEIMNLGVLYYIPKLKRLSFIFPSRLSRLTSAFPSVNERALKAYLRGFAVKVKFTNQQPDLFSDYDLEKSLNKFAEKELIPVDASSLQFTEGKKGLSYATQPLLIDDDLFNSYLSAFRSDDESSHGISDDFLVQAYKNQLHNLINEYRKKSFKDVAGLSYNYELQIKDDKKFKFEVAWKNGSLNLVQPVSFDLKSIDKIFNKGYRNFGKFTDLEEYAESNNYKFDLIVAPPRNKNFLAAYEDALGLLHKPSRVNIILNKDLEHYTIKTLEAISSNAHT